MRLLALAALAAIPVLAQTPSTVSVSSPQPALISGQQMQLSALARDSSGKAVTTAVFTWSSNHPEFATVDSKGMVTATGLGVADITAQTGNVRGTARVQSVPLMITVTPPQATLNIGQSQQFSASAYDVNGSVMSGVTFVWSSNGDNGGLSVAGTVDQNGLFTALGSGHFTVRAIVYYPGYTGDYVSQVFGSADVTVPGARDYKLTKLLSTDSIRQGPRLRPRRHLLAVNEQGRIAMNASLDGMSSGLISWDNGTLNLLASGGIAGVVPNGPVWDFSDPVMNSSGAILTRIDEVGTGSSIALIQNGVVNTVNVDGEILQSDEVNSGGTVVSRYALNDNGDFVFRVNFRADSLSPTVNGYYRYSLGRLAVDLTQGTSLPGLTSPYSFGSEFGLDNNGIFYFTATDGTNTGLFREDSQGVVTRVLLTGDSVAGTAITSIQQVAVEPSSGDVMVMGFSNPLGWYIARYSGAAITSAPAFWNRNQYFTILSFNRGGPALLGYGNNGYGVYTYNKGNVTPVLLPGSLTPAGEIITTIQSAALLGNGDVFAEVGTPSTAMTVIRLGPRRSTLFSAGARVGAAVNLTFRDIVPGARQGPVQFTMAGNSASIFQADAQGLSPVLLTGDSLPGDGVFMGIYTTRETPSGDLYVMTDQSIHRISGGKPTTIAAFSQTCEPSITCYTPFALAVNDNGGLAGIMNSSTVQRVGILQGSTMQIILRMGDRISGAGTVTGWNTGDFAMDASGRVMLNITGTTGSGYFLYSQGTWSPVVLLNVTNIGGVVSGISQLKAAGNTFYAFLSLTNGNFFIASWDGKWNPLISRGDSSPDGNQITNINSFDVNRNGDIGVVCNLNGTFIVMVRSADRTRVVHLQGDPIAPNWWVRTYGPLNLRDDLKVYFTAWSLLDQYALFEADPVN
jgi:hypothetical protein